MNEALRRARLWLMIASLFLPFAAKAQDLVSGFEAANRLYEKGQYSEAAGTYEKLLSGNRTSAALYFNLGNSWFKAGEVGRAIAAYRKAEQLSPRDPDLRANLQFARNQVKPPTRVPGAQERWLARLSVNEWAMLASIAFWAVLLTTAVLQWRPAQLRAWRNYLAGMVVIAIGLCSLLALTVSQTRFQPVVVVIPAEATVRQGPLDESKAAFTVHSGAELRVLDEKDGWIQVTTDPRRIGWLRRDQAL